MKTITKFSLIIVSIIFLSGCGKEQGDNWLQFRGPNSLGIAPENTKLPLDFNLDNKLLWKVSLASGLSSPCISGHRIFLTGYNPTDSALTTYCIDREKGSMLWEHKVHPDTLESIHTLGSYAVATPSSDAKSVYVYFGSYGVLCYDLKGKLQWQRRLPVLKAQYGTPGSPIIHDSLLIINRIVMQEPSILALNKKNGRTVWQHYMSLPPNAPVSICVSRSTPVIWEDQVIIHRGFEIVSLSLKDGSLKWTYGIASTGIGTPVITNNTLYVNCYYNMGDSTLFDKIPDFSKMLIQYDANHDNKINITEIPPEMAWARRLELNLPLPGDTLYAIRQRAKLFDTNKDGALGKEEWEKLQNDQIKSIQDHGTIALKLGSNGELNQPVLKWQKKEYVPEVPSLVVFNKRVFQVINGGWAQCLDAETGEIIFRERLGANGAYLASPLYANGFILFASYSGKITVIKADGKFEIVSKGDIREKIGASPVALGDRLFVRTESGLYAFRK